MVLNLPRESVDVCWIGGFTIPIDGDCRLLRCHLTTTVQGHDRCIFKHASSQRGGVYKQWGAAPRGVYKGSKFFFRYFHIFHASNDTLGHQKLHYSNYLALICNFDTISKCQTQHCDIAVLVHHFPTCLLQCCLCGHIK